MLTKFYFLVLLAFCRSSENSTEFTQDGGEEQFGDGRSYKWSFNRKKANETLEFSLKINLDDNNGDRVEKINVTDIKNKIQEIIVKKEPKSEKILLLTLNQPLTVEVGDQDRELVTVNNGDRDVADIETDFGIVVKTTTTPKNPFNSNGDFLDAMLLALVNATFPFINETETKSEEDIRTMGIFERTTATTPPNDDDATTTVRSENAAITTTNESTVYFTRCNINDKVNNYELACKWLTTPNRQMDIFSRQKFRAANFCELRASDFDDCRRSCELNGRRCKSVHFCRSCNGGGDGLNCRLMNQRAVDGKNRLQLIAEYGSVDYSEKNCGGDDEDDRRENDPDDSGGTDEKV